jgi:hypothetical protein
LFMYFSDIFILHEHPTKKLWMKIGLISFGR